MTTTTELMRVCILNCVRRAEGAQPCWRLIAVTTAIQPCTLWIKHDLPPRPDKALPGGLGSVWQIEYHEAEGGELIVDTWDNNLEGLADFDGPYDAATEATKLRRHAADPKPSRKLGGHKRL